MLTLYVLAIVAGLALVALAFRLLRPLPRRGEPVSAPSLPRAYPATAARLARRRRLALALVAVLALALAAVVAMRGWR